MNQQPFVIEMDEENFPNLAMDEDGSFGFTYDKTNVWQNKNNDIVQLLTAINQKLDAVIDCLNKNGRE